MILIRRTVVEIGSNWSSLPATIWQHLWQVSFDLFYIQNADMCWQWCIKVLGFDRRGMNSSRNSSSSSHSCSWWRRSCHLILLVIRWGYELTLTRNRRIGFNKTEKYFSILDSSQHFRENTDVSRRVHQGPGIVCFYKSFSLELHTYLTCQWPVSSLEYFPLQNSI